MEDKKTLRDNFTDKEIEALRKYVEDVKTWKAEEPQQLTDEEKIQIYQYAQQHNWNPPKKYAKRVKFDLRPDLTEGCDPNNLTYEHYLCDLEYEYWQERIYTIAPAQTIFKLLRLTRDPETINRGILFEYAPEDEGNRNRIEAAIKELCDETADFKELPFFPNSSIINLVLKAIATPKNIKSGRNNVLNGQISIAEYTDSLTITRKTEDEEQTIKIANLGSEFFGKKQGKAFCSYNKQNASTVKLFCYFLQRYSDNPGNYNVFISYEELVNVGMYKTIDGARRGLNSFYDYMHKGSSKDNMPAKDGVSISGVYKVGRRKVVQSENDLIIGRTKIEKGMVININPNIDMNIFTSSFTFLPQWVYSLETMNAFSLARYIFSRARQSGSIMRDPDKKDQNRKHPYKVFKISFDSIRDILGLPSAADVKGRKYKERIKDPIEKAIEEIEDIIDSINNPEKTLLMTLTPLIDISNCNIGDFLNGYLEIGILAEFSDKFIGIANKREKYIEEHRKKVEKERAKIEAKKTTENGA